MISQRAMFKTFGLHFSRWLWLFWPLRFFIRIKESPEGLVKERALALPSETETIYVLPRLVLMDVFVLQMLLRKYKLPRPRVEAAPGRFRKVALLVARFRKGLINPYEPREAFTDQLADLLRSDNRARTGHRVLQPVTVFFTRAAERSERNFLVRSLFPDDEYANSFQKFLFLLLHGGVVRVHLGECIPFSRDVLAQQDAARAESPGDGVKGAFSEAPASAPPAFVTNGKTDLNTQVTGHGNADANGQGQGDEIRWARRVRRQLLIDFARGRTSAMGPALYDVNAIANWIFKSAETRKVLESEPKSGRAQRKALHYLEEIAANYNYTTIRALEKMLDLVWTSIFKGVRVRNFEAVAEVARQGQLILMPCHRSHLDYMLLSYVMFKKGLVTPHIAAGVNLSFWPAGPILRRGGAFFIRRSFSGNKLYAHVLAQYIDFLMHNSFPVEFFHEGGRSRFGKLLAPRYGILNFCTTSILKRRAANTYIVPVYFGYDKVMEDGAYAAELGGMKKQKESVWQLLRSIRFLFSNYGSVDVSFGTPLHFGDAWKDFFSRTSNPDLPEVQGLLPTDLDDIPEGLSSRDARVQTFVRSLARRVNQGINSSAVASGSALLTSALCAQAETDVPRALLTERVRTLHGVVARLGSYIGWLVSPGSMGEGEVTRAPPAATAAAVEPVAGGADASDGAVARVAQGSSEQAIDHTRDRTIVTLAPMPTSASLDVIVEEILATGVQWEFMLEKEADAQAYFAKNPAKELNLWWYRGTIFHVLAIPGLVASLLLEAPSRPESASHGAAQGLRIAWLEAKIQALRNVWDEELYWPDSTSSAAIVVAALRVFSEFGLLTFDATDVRVHGDEGSQAQLRFLADLVRPERELYALMLATALVLMETRGRFSRDELTRKTYDAHRSAFLRGVASHPAHLTRVFASRTFEALFKSGVFVPRDNQLLAVAYTEVVSISDFYDVDVWREFVEPA